MKKTVSPSHNDTIVLWKAQNYTNGSHIQMQLALDFLKEIPIKGNEKVIDIGCGDGKITAYMAENLLSEGSIKGIDSSNDMIELAKIHHPPTIYENLSFECCDASHLEKIGKFDLAVSFSCFHWISDQLSALQSLHNHLQKNSKIYILCLTTTNEKRLGNALQDIISQKQWQPYFKEMQQILFIKSPKEFDAMCLSAGFHSVKITPMKVDVSFDNQKDLEAWLAAWLPYRQYLPSELRADFLHQVANRFLEFYPADKQKNVHYYDFFMKISASV